MNFDPNNSAPADSGLFALPCGVDDAAVVIVPAPWDATSSQARGSRDAYRAVLEASRYVELYDPQQGRIYDKGIAMAEPRADISELNAIATSLLDAECVDHAALERTCEKFNAAVEANVHGYLEVDKTVGLLGGDHSVSYGAIKAHLARDPDIGILHIDAHCDLRQAFDGIVYSHASIMYNVMERLSPARMVQVGVRAICDAEACYLERSEQVLTYFDHQLHARRSRGETWFDLCAEISQALPPKVYVSLDIDGLEPSCCPNTGTPVPGGLSYNDVVYLLSQLALHDKHVVGFDLVEVGAAATDANIAAHLLYQLCGIV